jgi:hypothetical protein
VTGLSLVVVECLQLHFFLYASFSHAFRWSTTNKKEFYNFTTPTGLMEFSCLEGII